MLKANVSKTTKSYLAVKAHSKYGQLTDEHKINTLEKMVTLNPLKYDVIVFSRGRRINKWKIFILGSNVALSPGPKFPVNGLIHVFCKLWLAKELFMVTIHISILELYG